MRILAIIFSSDMCNVVELYVCEDPRVLFYVCGETSKRVSSCSCEGNIR